MKRICNSFVGLTSICLLFVGLVAFATVASFHRHHPGNNNNPNKQNNKNDAHSKDLKNSNDNMEDDRDSDFDTSYQTTVDKTISSSYSDSFSSSSSPSSSSSSSLSTSSSSSTHTHSSRRPILQEDVVSVEGRHLVTKKDGQRFYVKGIAFPNPPPHKEGTKVDISGWNAVLEQLASDSDINTIRVYDMDCGGSIFNASLTDYSPFLERAAELGIYVIVPFTSLKGDGVLGRDFIAPKCYPPQLYKYGTECIERYWHHPNVLAGVIGNEVTNNLKTWNAAPCIKSYFHDLQKFITQYNSTTATSTSITSSSKSVFLKPRSTADESSSLALPSFRTSFPLMYATQHDSPSANLLPDEAVKLTLDYLACKPSDNNKDSAQEEEDCVTKDFIFGINIESWCSSLQSFEYSEDHKTHSTYYQLWKTLGGGADGSKSNNSTTDNQRGEIPLIFSEMGCSLDLMNRDNEVMPKKVRDWKDIPVVLNDMSDIFSGFCAYGYDGGGSPFFRMMGGDNQMWDGQHVLPPSLDYNNFVKELAKSDVGQLHYSTSNTVVDGASSTPMEGSIRTKEETVLVEQGPPGAAAAAGADVGGPPGAGVDAVDTISTSVITSCNQAVTKLKEIWGLDLYPLSKMPSYFSDNEKAVKSSSTSTSTPTGLASASKKTSMMMVSSTNGSSYNTMGVTAFVSLCCAVLVVWKSLSKGKANKSGCNNNHDHDDNHDNRNKETSSLLTKTVAYSSTDV